jgi:hypothetical protein
MTTTSGRVSIVIAGVPYSARGETNLNASNISVEAGSNADGSLYRTVTPKPRKASITFDANTVLTAPDGSRMKWDERLLLITDLPVTFTEIDNRGKQHLMTGAFFTGDPAQNLSTGELSGLEIAYDSYETV